MIKLLCVMTPLNVFIVDDEPDAGFLLKNLLDDFSYLNIRHILNDANQALDSIIQEQPNVIFLDIEMPALKCNCSKI